MLSLITKILTVISIVYTAIHDICIFVDPLQWSNADKKQKVIDDVTKLLTDLATTAKIPQVIIDAIKSVVPTLIDFIYAGLKAAGIVPKSSESNSSQQTVVMSDEANPIQAA